MGDWHWLLGNHDRKLPADLAKLFASVEHYKRLKVGGQALILFHYPIMSWHGMHRGAWHLHGHCHGNLREYCHACRAPTVTRRMDVGIDTHPAYMPYHYDEIAAMLGSVGEPTAVDHHEPR